MKTEENSQQPSE